MFVRGRSYSLFLKVEVKYTYRTSKLTRLENAVSGISDIWLLPRLLKEKEIHTVNVFSDITELIQWIYFKLFWQRSSDLEQLRRLIMIKKTIALYSSHFQDIYMNIILKDIWITRWFNKNVFLSWNNWYVTCYHLKQQITIFSGIFFYHVGTLK